MKIAWLVAVLSLFLAGSGLASPQKWGDVSLKDLKGKPIQWQEAKVVVFANIASRCGYTPQLDELQKLYVKYKDRGLLVVGFPSNDFRQEPLEGQEIAQFCSLKYNADFPISEKGHVIGKDVHPLFQYLTTHSTNQGPVAWNFEKFVVQAADGKILDRFPSGTTPLSAEMAAVIEKALAAGAAKHQ